MRTEKDVREDLIDAEACLARLDERRQRLIGHIDQLRDELTDHVGSDRNVVGAAR
jgi:hypothetical protein